MQCDGCGATVDDSAVFCPSCGRPLAKQTLLGLSDVASERILSDRYIILSLLGRGGLGTVYLARDTQLEKTVALKVLPKEVATDLRAIEMMKEEVRIAQDLRHENIGAVYNFEVDTEKQASFIVMEFVDGVDLHTLLGRMPKRRFSLIVVAHILQGCAEALDYAHSKRIIHRDVKPKNIIMRRDGVVKMLDFGIARRLSETMSRISREPVAGTPTYMSPEQLSGRGIDRRSDIYSLGVMTYELLTGSTPFPASGVQLAYQVLHKPIQPLKAINLVDGNIKIAKSLTDVLKKCLAKTPEERFETAKGFYKAFTAAAELDEVEEEQREKRLSEVRAVAEDALRHIRKTFSHKTPSSTHFPSTDEPKRRTVPQQKTSTVKPKKEAKTDLSAPVVVKPKKRRRFILTALPLILAATVIAAMFFLHKEGFLFPKKEQEEVVPTVEKSKPKLAVAEFLVEGNITSSPLSLANRMSEKIEGNFETITPLGLRAILETLNIKSSQLNDLAVSKRLYTERGIRRLLLCSVVETTRGVEITARLLDLERGSTVWKEKIVVESEEFLEEAVDVLAKILFLEEEQKRRHLLSFDVRRLMKRGDFVTALDAFKSLRRIADPSSLRELGTSLADALAQQSLKACSEKRFNEALDLLSLTKEVGYKTTLTRRLPDELVEKFLEEANRLLEEGDRDNAVRLAEKALSIKETKKTRLWLEDLKREEEFEALLAAAKAALSAGRFRDAAMRAREVLKLREDDERAKRIFERANSELLYREFRSAAEKEFSRKRYNDAIRNAEEALKFKPDDTYMRELLRKAEVARSPWSHLEKKLIIKQGCSINAVAFSPDGTTIVTAGADGIVRVWSIAENKCLRELKGHTDEVKSVAFGPDGKILSGGLDKTVRLWGRDSECMVLGRHEGAVYAVAFSPDGETAASAGGDDLIYIWDVAQKKPLRKLEGHTDDVRSIDFSPDGKLLLSGGWDKTVRLWDPQAGRLMRKLEDSADWVWSVVFNADGKLFASSSWAEVRIWKTAYGKHFRAIKGHTGYVLSVAFSPDSAVVATGGADRKVRIWHLLTGKCLSLHKEHKGVVQSVVFAPVGKMLATADDKGEIIIWQVPRE